MLPPDARRASSHTLAGAIALLRPSRQGRGRGPSAPMTGGRSSPARSRFGPASWTTRAPRGAGAFWPSCAGRSARSAGAVSRDIGHTTWRAMWRCCGCTGWSWRQAGLAGVSRSPAAPTLDDETVPMGCKETWPKIVRARATTFPPPCGEGQGGGLPNLSARVPPTPNPSPQGGGESGCFVSDPEGSDTLASAARRGCRGRSAGSPGRRPCGSPPRSRSATAAPAAALP